MRLIITKEKSNEPVRLGDLFVTYSDLTFKDVHIKLASYINKKEIESIKIELTSGINSSLVLPIISRVQNIDVVLNEIDSDVLYILGKLYPERKEEFLKKSRRAEKIVL